MKRINTNKHLDDRYPTVRNMKSQARFGMGALLYCNALAARRKCEMNCV